MIKWIPFQKHELVPNTTEVELSDKFGYKFKGKKWIFVSHTSDDYSTLHNPSFGFMTVNTSEVGRWLNQS